MQIIATRSIWQQASLVLTPSQLTSQLLSLLYKQIVLDDSDLNKSLKKKKKKRKRKTAFRIRFWNPGELWERTLLFLALRFELRSV